MDMDSSLALFDQWRTLAKLSFKPYQTQGIRKMLSLEMDSSSQFNHVKGGFLCDEMGLGKTIQMLGLIYSNLKQRTLIVLPNALIKQWEVEIFRLLGHRPFVFHGSRKSHGSLQDATVVLTTYGTFSYKKRSGKSFTRSKLHSLVWDRVIYDEAHHLRNKNTSAFDAALNVKAHIKWFVTGTPTQNKLADVFSLCKLLGLQTCSRTQLPVIAGHFKIARTKAQVGLQLLPVADHDVVVPWQSQLERQLAQDIHSFLQFSNINASNVDAAIKLLSSDHLPALLRARQSCIMPSLFYHKLHELVADGSIDALTKLPDTSSKVQAVYSHILKRRMSLSTETETTPKQIVFCHFRNEIQYLHSAFTKAGISSSYIDGSVSSSRRSAILSDSPDVLLLQIQTASEGLNLQQYSDIYFTAPHWNPAIEDQAVARAHRIGQTHQVCVFRFIMEQFHREHCTIDHYIRSVQQIKRELYSYF